LGLQEGDFVRIFTVVSNSSALGSSFKVNALTTRVFTGSATEVARGSTPVSYPDQAELYLDKDARMRLGFPERGWAGTPAFVRPALWRALASRIAFYGLTVLLGITALIQLLQAYGGHLGPAVNASIALAVSLLITFTVSVIDLRARFRY
jgi:hypothetical protein